MLQEHEMLLSGLTRKGKQSCSTSAASSVFNSSSETFVDEVARPFLQTTLTVLVVEWITRLSQASSCNLITDAPLAPERPQAAELVHGTTSWCCLIHGPTSIRNRRGDRCGSP